MDIAMLLLEPADWPRKWRRLFLLTLPLSGPAWLLYVGIMLAVALVMTPVLAVAGWFAEMWSGGA